MREHIKKWETNERGQKMVGGRGKEKITFKEYIRNRVDKVSVHIVAMMSWGEPMGYLLPFFSTPRTTTERFLLLFSLSRGRKNRRAHLLVQSLRDICLPAARSKQKQQAACSYGTRGCDSPRRAAKNDFFLFLSLFSFCVISVILFILFLSPLLYTHVIYTYHTYSIGL